MGHLLIVDDEEGICWCLARLAAEMGHTAATAASAEEALALAKCQPPDAVFLDIRLPGVDGLTAMPAFREAAGAAPIVIMTAFGNLDTAVAAVRGGALDYLPKPFDLEHAAETIRRAMAAAAGPGPSPVEPSAAAMPGELLGASPVMQEVFKRIALAAPTDVSALIGGESGTGKELVARAIHRHSLRASEPLLSVNLAALSPTLVESELFGHVRGAFTGAETSRRGLLELGDKATVFFDEIADVPLAVQVKLLRVLEQHEVTPVGEVKARPTHFRVIAATSRDLRRCVREGTFREDLFFRLAGFEITLPPLRQRPADVPLLAEHFLRLSAAADAPPGFTPAAVRELARRQWPGNVRELRNAVEHAAILARGQAIGPEHLPADRDFSAGDAPSALRQAVQNWVRGQFAAGAAPHDLYGQFLAEVESPLFQVVLDKTNQNRSAAAELLGIHRATLRKRLDG